MMLKPSNSRQFGPAGVEGVNVHTITDFSMAFELVWPKSERMSNIFCSHRLEYESKD